MGGKNLCCFLAYEAENFTRWLFLPVDQNNSFKSTFFVPLSPFPPRVAILSGKNIFVVFGPMRLKISPDGYFCQLDQNNSFKLTFFCPLSPYPGHGGNVGQQKTIFVVFGPRRLKILPDCYFCQKIEKTVSNRHFCPLPPNPPRTLVQNDIVSFINYFFTCLSLIGLD